jgi:hypothetical protein
MPKRSNAITLMTADQANLLRQLAFDAYEPEAFSPSLTKAEAEERIAVLQAAASHTVTKFAKLPECEQEPSGPPGVGTVCTQVERRNL